MDKTTMPLFDAYGDSETFLAPQTTQRTSRDNTRLGKPRNSTRTGTPLTRKSNRPKKYNINRGHAKTFDKWMEDEPDYKESEVYQWAKNEVLRRVENTSICTYGGLTRHLESERPGTSQYLDSIIDDLSDRISHDKHKPAPSLVTKIGIDTKKIDYMEVFG